MIPRKVVSVFGSSRPQAGSDVYLQGQEVGRLLAEAQIAVATGGYGGLMAAVSQGAAVAGGHVIGVTSDHMEQFRPQSPNQWIHEEIRYATPRERLLHLVLKNDGMLIMPGGIGTLAEMALAWSSLQTGEIEIRPCILLGALWRDTVQKYFQAEYIRPQDFELLEFAEDAATAVSILAKRLA